MTTYATMYNMTWTPQTQHQLTTPCLIWTGIICPDGYGRLNDKNRTLVHRVAWLMAHPGESITHGWEIDHLCRVRACYEPTHLEAVVKSENRRRAALVITHCVHGHEFTPQNTVIRKNGSRYCRACGNRAQAEYQARKRGKV